MSGLFDLSGRTAIVTGALGRLGPVWCRALLEAGARVFATDLLGSGSGQKSRVESLGVFFHPADLRYEPHIRESFRVCRQQYGQPDILVNNAGIDVPPTNLPEEVDWIELFSVNVETVAAMCEAFAYYQSNQSPGGSIINIGSLYASVSPDPRLYSHLGGFVKHPAYGASKAAVVNLTKQLAVQYAPFGVRVNCLSPGGVLGDQDSDFIRKYCERVPLGRMALPESDLAGPLLFLASDASSYVTGHELRVDGGWTAL